MRYLQIFVLVVTLAVTILVSSSGASAADSTLVETMQIPANSMVPISSINTFQSGVTYILQVSGNWQDKSQPNHYSDAEYTTFDGWQTYMDGTPNWGPQQKDLMVNGSFVDWGVYNTSHNYELLYTGTGAPINFMVIDKDPSKPIDPAWYADNIGGLTVTIYRVNHAPTSDAQSISTPEDTSIAITLTGSDADMDTLAFAVVTAPAHGTLSGAAPNLTYTPASNYNGADSFTFKANDGTVSSGAAAVSIIITPVNDPPVLSPIANQTITAGQTLTFSISASDIDNSNLIYTISNLPNGASFNPTTRTFTWKPCFNQAGNYQVTFAVSDGALTASNAVNITVNAFSIKATLKIEPSTLNLKSKGGDGSITVEIKLLAGYDKKLINTASVTLTVNGVTISCQPRNSCGSVIKFDRQDVISALAGQTGNIIMTVNGQLLNGIIFTGFDTIKVISPGK
jgi:hypothetical protein